MKAIILAGGIGSRLSPITESKPKAMVEVVGKPMLGYIVDALQDHDLEQLVVCTGYRSAQIEEFLHKNYSSLPVEIVENEDYETTNNMYGLYLTREFLDDDVLIMNGDLVFEPSIIEGMLKQKMSCVAVDKDRYLEEAMKIVVKDGRVCEIAKTVTEERAYGSSIDVYLLRQREAEKLRLVLEEFIETKEELKLWSEVALDLMFQNALGRFEPYDIGEKKWYEIDNFDDLAEAELLFNPHLNKLKKRSVFFMDRDGTLTIEDGMISGADAFLNALKQQQKHAFVMTNNSSQTIDEHHDAFSKKGLRIPKKQILVSLDATIDYLKANKYKRVFWLASKKVGAYIKSQGFRFDAESPEAVMVTWDRELTYQKQLQAIELIRSGLPYVATHPDMVCPTAHGVIPDIGLTIIAIKECTGRDPDLIFGKPNKAFIQPTLDKLELRDKDAVVVGDRLYTDIALARDSKILSVLVLSGETDRAMYEASETQADIVVESVEQLVEYLT